MVLKATRWALFIIFATLLLLDAVCAFGQSISPLSSEAKAGKKITGEFSVANSSLSPLTVTVEAHSFTMNKDGHAVTGPLSPDIHLELDSMTAKLGVKQTRTFAWKASCNSYPCYFAIYAAFSGGHIDNGVAVRLILPTSVYICADRAKGCRDEIRQTIFHITK